MPIDHVLPKVISEHRGRDYVQVKDELVKPLRISQEIAVVIDTGVIDEHFYLNLLLLAVVI